MSSINKYKPVHILLLSAAIAVFYASAFFVSMPPVASSLSFGQSPLSAVAAVTFIIIDAILLSFGGRETGENYTIVLPFIFFLLVLSNPINVYMTSYHAASPLLILSYVLHIKFMADIRNTEKCFFSYFFLACASLILPWLIWMVPVFLLSDMIHSEERSRVIAIILCAIILPMMIKIAVTYIFYDLEYALRIPVRYWSEFVTTGKHHFIFSAAELFRSVAVTIICIISSCSVLRRSGTFKSMKRRTLSNTIYTLFFVFLITSIFCIDHRLPAGLLLYPFATLPIHEYFVETEETKGKSLIVAALFLIIITERVIQIVG